MAINKWYKAKKRLWRSFYVHRLTSTSLNWVAAVIVSVRKEGKRFLMAFTYECLAFHSLGCPCSHHEMSSSSFTLILSTSNSNSNCSFCRNNHIHSCLTIRVFDYNFHCTSIQQKECLTITFTFTVVLLSILIQQSELIFKFAVYFLTSFCFSREHDINILEQHHI